MIEVNEFFDGKVKSLVVNSPDGKKTVGVMEEGDYEFDTDLKETITVVTGEMSVYFDEYGEWEDFGAGSSFDVPATAKLQVRAKEETAYLCEYGSPKTEM